MCNVLAFVLLYEIIQYIDTLSVTSEKITGTVVMKSFFSDNCSDPAWHLSAKIAQLNKNDTRY